MNEMILFSGVIILGAFVASVSQIMLKKSAMKKYPNKLAEYLNPTVIIAYIMFFGCTLLSMYGLKVVPLSVSPVLEASGYIFVAVLSYIFLKEKMSRRQIIGIVIIIAGIIISSLDFGG